VTHTPPYPPPHSEPPGSGADSGAAHGEPGARKGFRLGRVLGLRRRSVPVLDPHRDLAQTPAGSAAQQWPQDLRWQDNQPTAAQAAARTAALRAATTLRAPGAPAPAYGPEASAPFRPPAPQPPAAPEVAAVLYTQHRAPGPNPWFEGAPKGRHAAAPMQAPSEQEPASGGAGPIAQGYGTPGYGSEHYPSGGDALADYLSPPGYSALTLDQSSQGHGTHDYAAQAQGSAPSQGGQDYGPLGATGEPVTPGAGGAGLPPDPGSLAAAHMEPQSPAAGPAWPGFPQPASAMPGAATWPAAYPAPQPSEPAPVAGVSSAATRFSGPPAADLSDEPLYRVLGGLAVRDLTLVESLLQLIEQLESREEDPQQLDFLFQMDHLATRMRRNSENLLVLAGHDRESQDFDPVPLLDVARAAVSEITDYSRAQVAHMPEVQLIGLAADDVSHILAELLDNAMSKSPVSASVVIRAERTGDGTLVVDVEDSGIGIPADRLAEINRRLSRVPVIDLAVTRHMGLYVVGRLAHRHGIQVQLRERPYGGIVASVIVPSQLVRSDPDAGTVGYAGEAPGRNQQLGGRSPVTARLGIEAPGAEGRRARYQGAPGAGDQDLGTQYPGADEDTVSLPGDWDPGLTAAAGATRQAGPDQPGAAAQERGDTLAARAPAAGYPDAILVPRFEPADPSLLPKRKPGVLSAVNGIPAPYLREQHSPLPADEEPAGEAEADRIRNEFAGFQLGQRAARLETSGAAYGPGTTGPGPAESAAPGDPPGSAYPGPYPVRDTGEPAGGAPDEAEKTNGA
jgi:hypothetical protein